MAREAMDIRLRVLKESNKSRFDSYSVRNSELILSHITFRDCRVHIFSDDLSQNSCIRFHNPLSYLEAEKCLNFGFYWKYLYKIPFPRFQDCARMK